MKRYTLRSYEDSWCIYDTQEHRLLLGEFDSFDAAIAEMRRLNGRA